MRHQYDIGIIGNCAYMAHIDSTANVCWLCWPQFDSQFIFGSLLDKEKGGVFKIYPDSGDFSTKQFYYENTNVLCTEFTTPEGKFAVIDFAPRFLLYERYYKPLMLIRKIQLLEGEPVINVECQPVLNYGENEAAISMGSNHLEYHGYPEGLRLTTNIPLTFIRNKRSFILNEDKFLVLTYGIPLEANLEYTAEDFLRKTVYYWRDWVKSTYITPYYQDAIIRSALAIKLHQFEQTGAIIASATTSLPEFPGSGRTWDYRYCWLRDSYYTLSAFNHIGHFEELENFFQYIANIILLHKGRLQPMYTIDGTSDIAESEIPLRGYLDNRPVRIGNAAFTQTQNDVYGQVLVALLPLFIDRRLINKERIHSIEIVRSLLQMIDTTMEEPDAGLWEYRNKTQQHGYTFFFHWAGCHAAIKIFYALGVSQKEIAYAQKLRSRAAGLLEQCFNPKLGAYTDAIGSGHLDASLLQLITMGYLPPRSKKARSHLKALEEKLMSPDKLFYRYIHDDGFGAPETTFLICSFWYIDALALMGRISEAIELFQELLKYRNHLGLLSEDIDTNTGSQWGNFPQTYSHVGQINSAIRIARKLDLPIFLNM